MDLTFGYRLLASLHAAAQDAGNIHAPGGRVHNLLCEAYDGARPERCACGVPTLLIDLDQAVSAALVAEVCAATGLSERDLSPVLALDLDGLELYRAGWRTSYPHLKVLCDLREAAASLPADRRARRRALLASHGGRPNRITEMIAVYAPREGVVESQLAAAAR